MLKKKKKLNVKDKLGIFFLMFFQKKRDENMGKIMDSENRTLANITDICFPDEKTRLTKKNHYKNEIFPEQNENLYV